MIAAMRAESHHGTFASMSAANATTKTPTRRRL
jgi:hypothetical protein